jgi:butyrate kinase
MTYLAIDPGSTSTKVAVYWNGNLIKGGFDHPREDLSLFQDIFGQKSMRFDVISAWLEKEKLSNLAYRAVIGRGGLIRPVPGGVYDVNEPLFQDLVKGVNGQHASNLGGILAREFAGKYGCPAYIADPVVVDEMEPVARLSGLKGIDRKSIFHALNQKAMARKVAGKMGRSYDDVNLVVAHLGGGITVGAHRKGRVVDVNDGLSGDGPYSPERTGGLPVSGVAAMIGSGQFTADAMVKIAAGKGGVYSYLGITDIRELEQRAMSGDSEAELVLSGMIYQVAKEIGALAAALDGRVDGIVITGGIARSVQVTNRIMEKIRFIAPVYVEPGEHELEALIDAARRVTEKGETVKPYPPTCVSIG